MRLRISSLELTRLAALGIRDLQGPETREYLQRHLRLVSAEGPCPALGPAALRPSAAGQVVLAWEVECPSETGWILESRILLDVAPGHLHFARLDDPAAGPVERVLHRAAPRWRLADSTGTAAGGDPAASSQAGTGLAGYLLLGIEHILGGWDHLVFVLVLVLPARRLRDVAFLVTGFTVGHSATLAAAALGSLRPDPAAVEAVIALSILLVAAEGAWLQSGRDRRLPWAVASFLGLLALASAFGIGAVPPAVLAGLALFALCHLGWLAAAGGRAGPLRAAVALVFGLVHGFGFAGVLAEVGLPPGRLLPALLGFNLGVEVGQLAVVALLWPVLRGAFRALGTTRGGELRSALGAGAAGAGAFWFAVRHLG